MNLNVTRATDINGWPMSVLTYNQPHTVVKKAIY
jgi:hypothetical protein